MAKTKTARSSMTKSRSKVQRLDASRLDASRLDAPPVRAAMLMDVVGLVSQQRNGEYGEPGENMARTAQLFAAYLGNRPGRDIKPQDVPSLLMLLKIARLAENPSSMDSWRDVAGYASIGFEIMEASQPKRKGRPPKQK